VKAKHVQREEYYQNGCESVVRIIRMVLALAFLIIVLHQITFITSYLLPLGQVGSPFIPL